MKLTGITIFTEDVEKTTEFYKKLLHTEPSEQTEMSSTFYIGSFKFFIHKSHEFQPDFPPSEDHLEFKVDNVDKTCTDLQKEGLELLLPPRDYYWGHSAYLKDVDGRLIELHEGIENHK